MNWVFQLLRLIAVIPSGKSAIIDRIGLIVWTCLALGPNIAVIVDQWPNFKNLLNKLTIFSFFSNLSMFGNSLIRASLTLPSIYYLCMSNSKLFKTPVKCPDQMAIFYLDILLALISSIATVYFNPANGGYATTMFAIMTTTSNLLMILSTLMIGLAMTQLKVDQNKTTHYASEKLDAFKRLKDGISPLLFLVYFVKVLMLIVLPVYIFTGLKENSMPLWVSSLTVAYASVDLFYVNTVATSAYDNVKFIILQLRLVVKPNKCAWSFSHNALIIVFKGKSCIILSTIHS